MRAWLVVSAVFLTAAAAAPAHAGDPEVTAALTAFITDLDAGKPIAARTELFIPPDNDNGQAPLDPAALPAMLDKPKIKVLAAVLSPGGLSGWAAAEVSASVPRGGKLKKESLRVSAVLSKDGGAWNVRAAHWSATVKNEVPDMCGALTFEWLFESSVPKALEPPVKAVLEAFDAGKPAAVSALLSDDPRALAFGSAPKETFAGGKKVKGVFKKWKVNLLYWDRDEPKLPSRAGATTDGALLWMTVATSVPKLCTSYRTLVVLAKEPAGWRIVHQHFSEPIDVE